MTTESKKSPALFGVSTVVTGAKQVVSDPVLVKSVTELAKALHAGLEAAGVEPKIGSNSRQGIAALDMLDARRKEIVASVPDSADVKHDVTGSRKP